MPDPSVQQVFQDPKFRALPLADQRSVLGSLDPGFGKFSDSDQAGMIQQMLGAPPKLEAPLANGTTDQPLTADQVAQRYQAQGPDGPIQPPKTSAFSVPKFMPALGQAQPAGDNKAPDPNSWAVKLGKLIPQSAAGPLAAINKGVQVPVQMAEKGAAVGSDIGAGFIQGASGGASGLSPNPRQAPLTAAESAQQHPIATGVASGIGSVVGSAVSDPRNWPFLGAGAARPILQKLITTGFTGMMAQGTITSAKYLSDNWSNMSVEQRAQYMTQTGISAALTGLIAAHLKEQLTTPNAPATAAPAPPDLSSARAGGLLRPTSASTAQSDIVSPPPLTAVASSEPVPLAAGDIAPERVQAAPDAAPTKPTPAAIPQTDPLAQGASVVEANKPPPASVKAFVTRSDEANLSSLGYPPEIVAKLQPDAVQSILNNKYTYEQLKPAGAAGDSTPQSSTLEAPSVNSATGIVPDQRTIAGTHLSSNLESLRNQSFEQRQLGLSIARNPSEELTSPTLSEPKGTKGRIHVEVSGAGLDYESNPDHRAFIEHLLDTTTGPAIDVKVLNKLRDMGVSWVNGFNGIAESPELHVLDTSKVKITRIEKFNERPQSAPVGKFSDLEKAIKFGQDTYGTGKYRINQVDGQQQVTPTGWTADPLKLKNEIADRLDASDQLKQKLDSFSKNPEQNAAKLDGAKQEFQVNEGALLDKLAEFSRNAPAGVVNKVFDQHMENRVLPAAEEVGKMKDLAANFHVTSELQMMLRDPEVPFEHKTFIRKLLGQTEETSRFQPLPYVPDGPPGSRGAQLRDEMLPKIAETKAKIRVLLDSEKDMDPKTRARLEGYLERPGVREVIYHTRPKKGAEEAFKPLSMAILRETFGKGLQSKMGNHINAVDRAKLDDLNTRIKNSVDSLDPETIRLVGERRDLKNQLMMKFLDREATIRQTQLEMEMARANALGRGVRRTAKDAIYTKDSKGVDTTTSVQDVMAKAAKPFYDRVAAANDWAAQRGIKPVALLGAGPEAAAPMPDEVREAVAAEPTITPDQKAQFEKNSTFVNETLPARQEAVRILRNQVANEKNFLTQTKLNVQLEDALAKQHQGLRQAAKIQAAPYDDPSLSLYEKKESRILSSEVTSPADKQLALNKLRNSFPNEAIAASKGESNAKVLDAIGKAYSEPTGKGLASKTFPRTTDVSPESGIVGLPLLTAPLKAIGDAFMLARAATAPSMELSSVAEGTLRAHTGELARAKEILEQQLNDYSKSWDSRSNADSIDFIAKMERGLPQATAQDQAVATQLRGLLDERRQAITALDIGVFEQASGQKLAAYMKKIAAETDPAVQASMMAKLATVSRGFIENYFPHIWDNPGASKTFSQLVSNLLAKRPLQGPRDFLMAREYEFFEDGIQRGLIPVTFNPVKIAMLRLHEMDKFLMAWNIYKDAESKGMIIEDENVAKAMKYVKLDPRTFSKTVYAEPNQARVINNYLSPSLWNHSFHAGFKIGPWSVAVDIPAYRMARTINNVLNMAQLGLSAFHLTGTAINTSVSDLALSFQKLSRGEVGDALAPAARAVSIIGSPISAYFKGNAMLKEYMEPGKFAAISHLADAMEIAGGRARMDPAYKALQTDALQRNWRVAFDSNYSAMQRGMGALKGTLSVPTWALQKLASPIMENIVPRFKMGAFAGMAEDALQRIGPNAPEELVRRELDKAWDSVDNRFGQLVHDNVPWQRTTKDLLQLGFRSVGWNLGDIREGGGAVFQDAPLQAARLLTFRKPELTNRMAYVVALPIYVGFMGALLQYSRTGNWPQSPVDYFFPKNGQRNAEGEESRDNLPTYMRDFYAVKHDWQTTVTNKLSPGLVAINELWRNKDFYNSEIRHPDDPAGKQFMEMMGYALRSFAPFSFRNAQLTRQTGGSLGEAAQKFAGLTPAPSWAGRSPMVQRLSEMVGATHASVAGHTQQAFEEAQQVGNLRARLAKGQATGTDVMQAVQSGKISLNEMVRLQETKGQPFVDREFGSANINPAQAIELWGLADDGEKAHLRRYMLEKKADIYSGSYAKPEQQRLLQRYSAAGFK